MWNTNHFRCRAFRQPSHTRVEGDLLAPGEEAGPQGDVQPFGEAIVAVPVTVSVLRMVRQVAGMLDGEPVDRISYQMSGKLSGGLFSTERFSVSGEFSLSQLQSPAQAATDDG